MTTPYSGVPYPSISDLDDPAGDLERLAEFLDTRLTVKATNVTDRDSKYRNLPATSLCSAPGVLWMKMSSTANTWETIWETAAADDTTSSAGWRNIQYLSGFGPINQLMQAKRIGQQVWLRGSFRRNTGAFLNIGSSIFIGNVPSDCRPKVAVTVAAGISAAGSVTVPTCNLAVLPDGTIRYTYEAASFAGIAFNFNYWLD